MRSGSELRHYQPLCLRRPMWGCVYVCVFVKSLPHSPLDNTLLLCICYPRNTTKCTQTHINKTYTQIRIESTFLMIMDQHLLHHNLLQSAYEHCLLGTMNTSFFHTNPVSKSILQVSHSAMNKCVYNVIL